jgi:hypothetical protein
VVAEDVERRRPFREFAPPMRERTERRDDELCIRQHTSAYVSIREFAPPMRKRTERRDDELRERRIRQHPSVYVSIRQHT